jgi:hypothetical protein
MKVILLIMIGLSLLRAEYIRDDAKELVLDTTTNLIWQDDATPVAMVWEDTITYCEASNLGGYSNWRLPNYNELYSLVDRSIYSPALSPNFQNVVISSYYWSSTTYAPSVSNAWGVSFDNGYDSAYRKAANRYVR